MRPRSKVNSICISIEKTKKWNRKCRKSREGKSSNKNWLRFLSMWTKRKKFNDRSTLIKQWILTSTTFWPKKPWMMSKFTKSSKILKSKLIIESLETTILTNWNKVLENSEGLNRLFWKDKKLSARGQLTKTTWLRLRSKEKNQKTKSKKSKKPTRKTQPL